ncbi:MAG: hypothetical protein LQ348_001214 [Seirophora lacunosa]|nr:MAG: hypothetical protein LQ348_001214 [Seirophora lacunosa]
MHRASVYLPVEQIILAAAYLTPDMLQYQIDNIDDYRGPEIIASGVIVGILAAGAVVFRLVCRRHMEVPLSYDDYLIIAGLGYTVDLGNGKHLMAVGVPTTQKYIRGQYAFQFLWSAAMAVIKLSILLFYRRLFPKENTTARWRICHLALCIASVGLGVTSIFGIAFQCTPVAFLWDLTIPGGTCINFVAFFRFTNIANVLTDILILSMPIPVGTNVDIGIWSTVEPCIGVVSACLPVMAPFLRTHIISFSTSVFRSRQQTGGASLGYSGRGGASAHTGKSGSRDRRSFGRIGGEGKGNHLKGSQDEEMGIPLTEPRGVRVRESGTWDSS